MPTTPTVSAASTAVAAAAAAALLAGSSRAMSNARTPAGQRGRVVMRSTTPGRRRMSLAAGDHPRVTVNFGSLRANGVPKASTPPPPSNVDVSKLLKGVCAMVDVRVGGDAQIDCSDVVARKLQQMGATIAKRFSPRVTHVVLSTFTQLWKDKLAKWQAGNGQHRPVEIVSQLWVNACFVNQQRMKESVFFPVKAPTESVVTPRGRVTKKEGSGTDSVPTESAPTPGATSSTPLGSKKASPPQAMKTTTAGTKKVTPPKSKRATPPGKKTDASSGANSVGVSTPAPRPVARKRRALSMEPMTSDAILKLLGESSNKKPRTEEPTTSAPIAETNPHPAKKMLDMDYLAKFTPPVRTPVKTRRRQTIATPSIILSELTITANKDDCVSESCSEGEGPPKAPTPAAAAPSVEQSSDPTAISDTVAESDIEQTPSEPVVACDTPAPTEVSQESRSSIFTPVAPSKGEWACSICSCLNSRTRRLCKGCKGPRVAAMTESTPTKARQPSKPAKAPTQTPKPAKTPTQQRTPVAKTPTSQSKAKSPKPPLPPRETRMAKRTRAASISGVENIPPADNDIFADEKLTSIPVTPQPPRKKAKTAPPTPSSERQQTRSSRAVIGITGVDSETRGIIECAVHAIDANSANDESHRKSRVVKSVDYAAAVTHLIVGKDTKRTMKVLFAIARGAWIVSESWVFASLEKEQWLPEEEFELDRFSNRVSRLYPEKRHIFRSIRFFVGANVEPSREVLTSLIQCAGGEVVNQISTATMCVCGDGSLLRRANRAKIKLVTPKWLFDSIATMKLVDDTKYSVVESLEESRRATVVG